MPVVTESVILQTFAYGETSRILKLLTATHGLQSAIAKGARRPRSRYGGILEPFSEGVATLYIRETRDLQTLSDFELTHSGQSLGADLLRFGGASLIAEIVLRAAMEEPHAGLYQRVRQALRRLECEPPVSVEVAVLSEVWQLVACLGFEPGLTSCLDCDRVLDDDAPVTFDYAAGGVRCSDCAAGAPGKPIPAQARSALLAMLGGQPVVAARTEGHWWLLTRYLDHHVLEGSTLHSLSFLASARGQPCDN